MKTIMGLSLKLLISMLLLSQLTTPAQAGSNIDTLIKKGSDSFKTGDYATALHNYQQARKAGDKSPALTYNLGVTYYKLERYDDARKMFGMLLDEPEYSAIAAYNLGLINYALGNLISAQQWFKAAEESATDPKMKRLARLGAGKASGTKHPRRQTIKGKYNNLEFSFVGHTGLGYDDNVYMSPDSPYIDLARTGQPLITPKVQSGFYIPLRLSGKLNYHFNNQSKLLGSYSFQGDFYIDNSQDNANRSSNEFKFGYAHDFKAQKKNKNRLYGGILIKRYDRDNFDRDTGINKQVGLEDVSDRFSYTGLGIEGYWLRHAGRIQFFLDGKFESQDYEDQLLISDLDKDVFKLGGQVRYQPLKNTRLKLGYHYFSYEYDQRHARDALSNISVANPKLKYRYHQIVTGVSQRMNEKYLIYADYIHTERIDDFLGYNDYSKNGIKAGITYHDLNRLRAEFSATYFDTGYDNAFAFNTPIGGAKEYDGLGLQCQVNYSVSKYFEIWSELQYTDENSTDVRMEYQRLRVMLGAGFRY